MEAPEFQNPRASFLVDPGSDINLIKLRALQKEIIIETLNCIAITGITNELVKMIGTVQVTIFSTPVECHVIENTLPVSPDGTLGRPYLRQEQAQISFRHNTLVTVSNPITPIPFVDAESREASKALRLEIKPFARILRIKARTRQPITIDVSNSEVSEGYLPRLDTPRGLYIGETAATTQNGKCHVLAINTTEREIEFSLSPQEVIPFDFCEFPGEEFSDSETKEFPKYPQEELGGDYPDRVKRVIQALHMSHLSPEEKEYVFHWAEDYADIFHLNGEKLTFTHLIQHRIPTIDDKVIVRKQYRTPHEANDQIHDQIEKQYTSGIIGNSKSPYNSPLLIVPKKLDASGERK